MPKEEKERLVPNLRFKGFTDDWIQQKVENISEENTGGGTPSTKVKKYWNGDIPWIQSSDIEKDKVFDVVPEKFITSEAIINSTANVIEKDSIAIVTRVGVGKVAYIPFEYSTSQDFLSLQNLLIDSKFGTYLMHLLMKKMTLQTQGTSIKGVTKNQLLSNKVLIPKNILEQQKIGNIIEKIDRILTLEQERKLQLESLKLAFYQYIFGATEKKNELYFEQPHTEWNEVQFKDIIAKSFKGTIKVSDLIEGTTEYLDANRLNGGAPILCDAEVNVQPDDLLILWDGSKAGTIYTGFHGVLGSTLKSYTLIDGIDTSFVYHYLKWNEDKIIHSYTTPNIPHVIKDFDEVFKIKLPEYLEQVKVGRLLDSINKLIEKNEHNISNYISIKKILLSNMFV